MSGKPLTFETLKMMRRTIPVVPQLEFIASPHMTVTREDWSKVRSPGRAARRRRQGHRQNIRYYQAPDPKLLHTAEGKVFGHPETIDRVMSGLSREVDRRMREQGDAMMLAALTGNPWKMP